MAKFNGEVTFRVKFKNLGVPVGFGMTKSIIFHECATQIYVRSGWSKLSKDLKDERFEVEDGLLFFTNEQISLTL